LEIKGKYEKNKVILFFLAMNTC